MEHDRQRLLAIERLVVETICFNFNTRLPFPYVIKISKEFGGVSTLPVSILVDSEQCL